MTELAGSGNGTGRPGVTCRIDSLSVAEPLGGTAPTQPQLLIVEQPGPWGSTAVTDNRMIPGVRESLDALASQPNVKVFLARRGDRKSLDGERNVWLMTRVGRFVYARHDQIPEDEPVSLPRVINKSNDPEPTLLVCTNGARDQCCAIAGRELLRQLDSTGIWEISHLGGHRFAPTALRFPDGLVFGRLDPTSARALVAGSFPTPSHLRGRFGRTPWQQVAELSVMEKTGTPLQELDSNGDPHDTSVFDGRGSKWDVDLFRQELAPRRVSCRAEPVSDHPWIASIACQSM